jgi:hypothetical protein
MPKLKSGCASKMVGFCIFFFHFYWFASILLYVRTQSHWFSQYAYFKVEFSVTLNLCRSLFNIFRFVMFLCREEILRSALCYNDRVCARRIKSGGISFYLLFYFFFFCFNFIVRSCAISLFLAICAPLWIRARACQFLVWFCLNFVFVFSENLSCTWIGSSWLIMQQSTCECATVTTVDVVIVRLRRHNLLHLS